MPGFEVHSPLLYISCFELNNRLYLKYFLCFQPVILFKNISIIESTMNAS